MNPTLATYLLIALGGAFGAMARFGVGQLSVVVFGVRVPWHTFLINVTGCLGLGLVVALMADRTSASANFVYQFLAIGFLGAFTTFSTFEMETWTLLQSGRAGMALLYVLGSVGAGLVAFMAGMWLGRVVL